MSLLHRNNNLATIGGLVAFLVIGFAIIVSSCSPKYITKTETVIEYRDRIVHDSVKFEVPVEVEKIVTKDTISHLENQFAKSDARVSDGLLYHSLESKPQVITIPVEVHVTDTLWKESETITEIKEIEKPLSWWQKFRINAFWWLLAGLALSLVWIFRKQIFKTV